MEHFDLILDASQGTVVFSSTELAYSGQVVCLDEFMGIPIVAARIHGEVYRMFFDTGAQISYFQGNTLTNFPSAGTVTDFYPGVGQFRTETRNVEMKLGATSFTLRCGTLPGLLGETLMMADTVGIVGNQILRNRTVGYFPRRQLLVL